MSVSPNEIPNASASIKAVGLLSGGLDSLVAAKIVKDLGVDVYGVYFAQPWGCCDKGSAQAAADKLGIKFIPLQLDERYLHIIKEPKHGYGTALNPCRDCRIHMFSRAGDFMRKIGAAFCFTGEVIGQRPMSQLRESMAIIERESNLEGRLLRPLCAQLMEPTIPEKEGLIDRTKLLALNGRSRKEQIRLAEEFGFSQYPPPAGGCLLTDHNFAERMKDTLKYGYRNFRETIALKWGRHFRIREQFKLVLGRDENENLALMSYAHPEDYIMQFPHGLGPVLIIKGQNVDEDIFRKGAGLIRRFSKFKDQPNIEVRYWMKKNRNAEHTVIAESLSDEYIENIKV